MWVVFDFLWSSMTSTPSIFLTTSLTYLSFYAMQLCYYRKADIMVVGIQYFQDSCQKKGRKGGYLALK